MIVEERCYTLKPGTVPLYYRDYDPRGLKIQTRILGCLIGYFHTEIGELNQVVHL
jgi:NIPSNAP